MTSFDFGPLRSGWEHLPKGLHSPVWPGLLATLAMLALLLAFHQVVRGAVEQGDLRRAATAARSDAAWRCNALGGLVKREACLLQLGTPRPGEASLQALSLER